MGTSANDVIGSRALLVDKAVLLLASSVGVVLVASATGKEPLAAASLTALGSEEDEKEAGAPMVTLPADEEDVLSSAESRAAVARSRKCFA